MVVIYASLLHEYTSTSIIICVFNNTCHYTKSIIVHGYGQLHVHEGTLLKTETIVNNFIWSKPLHNTNYRRFVPDVLHLTKNNAHNGESLFHFLEWNKYLLHCTILFPSVSNISSSLNLSTFF